MFLDNFDYVVKMFFFLFSLQISCIRKYVFVSHLRILPRSRQKAPRNSDNGPQGNEISC